VKLWLEPWTFVNVYSPMASEIAMKMTTGQNMTVMQEASKKNGFGISRRGEMAGGRGLIALF